MTQSTALPFPFRPATPDLVRRDPSTGQDVSWPTVIYHGQCPDGFAAALCAWLYFEGRGDYIPMTHAQALPDLTGKQVYMLDIAFSRTKMERATQEAASLVVLDHHQSASDDLNVWFDPDVFAQLSPLLQRTAPDPAVRIYSLPWAKDEHVRDRQERTDLQKRLCSLYCPELVPLFELCDIDWLDRINVFRVASTFTASRESLPVAGLLDDAPEA